MDPIKERQKRQMIRVAITETMMALTILLLTIVLIFVVQGYGINPYEGVIERSGLVEIKSEPSGAVITIDGNIFFFRTDLSRTLKSGEHEVILSRDGYSSWKGNINVTEGMMYRLSYPRLFKLDREVETVISDVNVKSAFISPNHEIALINTENSTYLLKNNDGKAERINFDKSLSIIGISESYNRVLAKNTDGDFILINLNKLNEPINISKNTKKDWVALRAETGTMERLLGLSTDYRIYEINASNGEVTPTEAKNVASFSSKGSKIVYISLPQSEVITDEEGGTQIHNYRSVVATEVGTTTITEVYRTDDVITEAKINLSEYFNEYYIILSRGENIAILTGKWPSEDEKMKEVVEQHLGWTPEEIRAEGNGKSMYYRNGDKIAMFDSEEFFLSEYGLKNVVEPEIGDKNISVYGWLDQFEQYIISEDGKLVAISPSGDNHFTLAENVANNLPAFFSENGEWVYYFTENRLERQKIK